MRSFSVRSAPLLVIVLLAVLYFRPGSTDVPPDDPLPADRSGPDRAVPIPRPRTLLTPPIPTSTLSPEDALIATMRARIADLDGETNGSFLETLDAVLADPTQSVAVESFRIPARAGPSAMLDTFPDEATSAADEHGRLVLIIVASAFRGCASDGDYRRRLAELEVRYPWLAEHLSRP